MCLGAFENSAFCGTDNSRSIVPLIAGRLTPSTTVCGSKAITDSARSEIPPPPYFSDTKVGVGVVIRKSGNLKEMEDPPHILRSVEQSLLCGSLESMQIILPEHKRSSRLESRATLQRFYGTNKHHVGRHCFLGERTKNTWAKAWTDSGEQSTSGEK